MTVTLQGVTVGFEEVSGQLDLAAEAVTKGAQGLYGVCRRAAGGEFFAQCADAHFQIGGHQAFVLAVHQLHGLPAFELLACGPAQGRQQLGFGKSQGHPTQWTGQAEGLPVQHQNTRLGRWCSLFQAPSQAVHAAQQFGLFDGLDQVIVGSAIPTGQPVTELGACGQHHDAGFGLAFANAGGQAEAVFPWQVDVDQVQIGQVACRGVVDILGAHHTRDLVSLLDQEVNGGFSQTVVVFHQHNVQRRRRSHGADGLLIR